jgi:S1-C subfamily serine protease
MRPAPVRAAIALLACLAGAPGALAKDRAPLPGPQAAGGGLQEAIRRAAAEAVPTIVQVEVSELVQDYHRQGLGSGVVFRQENGTAFVVTNNHVVGQADEINVRLSEGQSYPGTLLGRDPRRDLAVLRFQAPGPLAVARFGDSSAVRPGDMVLAVGSPLGLNSSVTLGVVSAVGRRGGPGDNISDFIQTDAVINPGNSGGALLNLAGEVIGINTWIASDSGSYEGYGFALPSASVERSIHDILASGRARYGWLGVGGIDPPPELREQLSLPSGKGALLANLYLGGPAAKAGLELGDYLTEVGGMRIDEVSALIQAVADQVPGSAVPVRFTRGGQPLSLQVQLGERAEEERLARNNNLFWPGLVALGAQEKRGVELAVVFPGTPAARAGLRVGDLVTAVDGETLDGLPGFLAALNHVRAACRLTVQRGEDELAVELGREGTEGVAQ